MAMKTITPLPDYYKGSLEEWNLLNHSQRYKIINKDKILAQRAAFRAGLSAAQKAKLKRPKLIGPKKKPGTKKKPPPADYHGSLAEWTDLSQKQRSYIRRKKQILESCKIYRDNPDNKEKIATRKMNYDNIPKNKERKAAWATEHRTLNKDAIAIKKKKYAEDDKNKDRIAAIKRKSELKRRRDFYEMFGDGIN
jgi:hypothetical protein